MSLFKKAERKKAKLRLGISGVSGSGKTWSALEIATGMGGKIAMIDTESGRGELYGEDFEYDVMQITAPYSPDKYIQAIKEAQKLGYNILIIDSLSHAWNAEGGVLSMVDKAGGSFNAWGKVGTPKQNMIVDAIISSSMHIIFTMRSKADYVMETVTNKQGKEVQAPKKVGTAPIQREGLEYECTLYMDMSLDHIAHVTKDNTKLYDQQYVTPTKEMGEKLMEWLNYGSDNPPTLSENDVIAQKIIQYEINMVAAKTINELQKEFLEARAYAHSKGVLEHYKERLVKAKEKKKSEFQVEMEHSEVGDGLSFYGDIGNL